MHTLTALWSEMFEPEDTKRPKARRATFYFLRIKRPLYTPDPPIPIRRHRLKQARTQIHITKRTRLTRIHNRRFRTRARRRVEKRYSVPAFGIRVWVGAVGHHSDGEGADGVVVGVSGAAGADADGVVRYVAGVGAAWCCWGGGGGGCGGCWGGRWASGRGRCG